jgi:hypothetical protein
VRFHALVQNQVPVGCLATRKATRVLCQSLLLAMFLIVFALRQLSSPGSCSAYVGRTSVCPLVTAL